MPQEMKHIEVGEDPEADKKSKVRDIHLETCAANRFETYLPALLIGSACRSSELAGFL